MKKKINKKIIIFTDLDGSLLDRETFRFDSIKKYILKLKKKRFVDKNILDSIKNQGISASIF